MVMKTQKYKFLALVVLFIFVACSGTKKVTTTKETLQVKSDTEVSKTAEIKLSGETTGKTVTNADFQIKSTASAEENETEETTIHTIMYDLKSKTDSLTKRPAVAQEIIQHTTKGKNKKAAETNETLYSANEVAELFKTYFNIYEFRNDSLSEVITSLRSEASTKETPVNNWWKWLLVGIFIPVISWFAVKMSWPGKVFVWLLNLFRVRK